MKLFTISVLCNLILIGNSFGVTLKIGVLAPEGTNWAKSMKKMAKEIKVRTKGQVKLKIYFGGVMGDEPEVLTKIRIGQMHGGVFTGRTLGDISGDVRVIELPFSFYGDREKAWDALIKNEKFFNAGFNKSGFINLGFFEIGLVYVVSTKEASSLADMKGIKVWSWKGDELVSSLVKSMDLISVPLSLPDVLPSLSTGIIHAAYSSPLGIIALQWSSKVKYFIDFPVSFSVGALIIQDKYWNKISSSHQKIIRNISYKHISDANKSTIKENIDALKTLKNLGIKFIKFSDEDIAKGAEIRKSIVANLEGKMFSKKAFDMIYKK